MRRKLLRSFLASLLILVFAASFLPTITANARQSIPSARRGKNGGAPGKTESQPITKNPQSGTQSQSENRPASPEPVAADADATGEDGATNQSESSATTGDSRNAQQQSPPQSSRRKPEPPPFDRPPMNPNAG